VTITGERGLSAGRDARLQAHLANGAVSFVDVIDLGAGYVDPLTVVIAPLSQSWRRLDCWRWRGLFMLRCSKPPSPQDVDGWSAFPIFGIRH
jgi:hypothetical protein